MSNEEKEIREQIREMARLTMLSNKINHVQERNLKMYPMVYFESVSKVTIDYDLSNDRQIEHEPSSRPGEKYVEFRIVLDESKNDKLDIRFKLLEDSVRFLFWADTNVYVYFNDKKTFESTK